MWCIDAMLSLESTSFSPSLVTKTVGIFEMVAVLDQGASHLLNHYKHFAETTKVFSLKTVSLHAHLAFCSCMQWLAGRGQQIMHMSGKVHVQNFLLFLMVDTILWMLVILHAKNSSSHTIMYVITLQNGVVLVSGMNLYISYICLCKPQFAGLPQKKNYSIFDMPQLVMLLSASLVFWSIASEYCF